MKKIVIIGASELQNPLILKAKEMGFETHVFAWEDGSIGERTADKFYPISIVEKERIFEICREIKPDSVVSIASDLANITVNYIARNLGLPANTEHCILISTNKFEMRKVLKAAGLYTPEFKKVGVDDDLEEVKKMRLPIIVKPTDRSGSRSITKIDDLKDLKPAIERAVNVSFEHKAIVEEYIEGNEYSCECITQNDQHHFLAVTKKFTTGAPHFIETGHIEPSGLDDETLKRVKSVVFKALDALEMRYGASHSEFKIDDKGNINIIEIGTRMGGGCIGSDLVRLSTGYDFLKMVIDASLGNELDLTRNDCYNYAAVKFILNSADLDAFHKLEKENPNILQRVSGFKLDVLNKTIDCSTRAGYYILASQSDICTYIR